MAEDLFDQLFPGLDEYYPNSKRKRKPYIAKKDLVDSSWEDDFYLKTLPNGTQVKMYTIGTLSKALSRPTKTVRFWIEKGYFPASPYRLPDTVGSNGKVYQGRRLYTKAMVESAIEVLVNAGLFGSIRIDWRIHRNLSDKIAEAWSQIREEEMKTTTKE